MKTLLLLLLSICFSMHAQNAKITLKNGITDTVQITHIGHKNIYYWFNNNGKITSTQSKIKNVSNITIKAKDFKLYSPKTADLLNEKTILVQKIAPNTYKNLKKKINVTEDLDANFFDEGLLLHMARITKNDSFLNINTITDVGSTTKNPVSKEMVEDKNDISLINSAQESNKKASAFLEKSANNDYASIVCTFAAAAVAANSSEIGTPAVPIISGLGIGALILRLYAIHNKKRAALALRNQN